MTPYQERRAYACGIAFARHLYQTLLNPAMQGPNFCWKNFPKMVEDRIRADSYMYMPLKDKDFHDHDQFTELAVESGLNYIKNIGIRKE